MTTMSSGTRNWSIPAAINGTIYASGDARSEPLGDKARGIAYLYPERCNRLQIGPVPSPCYKNLKPQGGL